MARTNIPVTVTNNNGAAGISFNDIDVAIDDANNHMYINRVGSSRIIILFLLEESCTVDVSIISVADPYGRTGDLGPTTIATGAGEEDVHIFGPFSPELFSQKSGTDVGKTYIDLANDTGAIRVAALAVA